MAKVSAKQETRYRWQKGQSGNPNGRPPKERTLVTHIERYLVMTQEQLKTEAAKLNLTIAQYLAVKYLLDCSTHPTHTDKLMDRLYGAAQTAVDVTSKGNEIKQSRIYNIIVPETKLLLEKLEHEGRMEPHPDISPEPKQLSQPAVQTLPE